MFPYTPEVLTSTMAAFNTATLPLAVVAFALMLGSLLLAAFPRPGSGLLIGGILAAGWVWTAVGWHFGPFAGINFAGPVYGIFFLLQAGLILWLVLWRGRVAFPRGIDGYRAVGGRLALLALIGIPAITPLVGGDVAGMRVAGMAPGPTAVLTIGLLLMARDRRGRWAAVWLAVIPLLWCLAAGVTAWLMTVPEDMALPVLGLGGFALLIVKARRVERGGDSERAAP
ncbi:hypothetical protein KAJ83_07560 [Marivibrio halodurans]|uniref:MFS transporter permease n=1 Tax=Marivibrio halodurans TaxID=2039722 RepID=A0A8J7S1A4_9PROT|nr:DUF6064 family protein [Marivibrio halodurans]MBP5856859.1 hypothetical protein [Marivibrio halodurans]